MSSRLLLLAFFLFATGTIAQDHIGGLDTCEAKATALDAVTAMFLRPDAGKLLAFVDQNAEWKDHKPGSALNVIDELKDKDKNIAAIASIQQVRFFSIGDLPELREQFPNVRLWNADRVAQRLANCLGCLIVWQNMDENRPRDTELNVLIVKKINDAYRVVYFDDLP